jgi:cytochrome P450 family 144
MSAMGDRLPMTLVAKLIGLPEREVPQLVDWRYGSNELLGGVVNDDRLPVVVDAQWLPSIFVRRHQRLEVAFE